VRHLDKVLDKQNYTLAIADIPYGFSARGSENDDVPFDCADNTDMVESFKRTMSAPLWRFVIIHPLQQTDSILKTLGTACNAGVEAGIWMKPNISAFSPGNRLAWGFKNWAIGYQSPDGTRSSEMYNFDRDEGWLNIIRSSCVTNKSVDALGKIVNPYQKPVALSSWFVEHFSNTGDWVAGLCCGTGGTLVASLLKNRCGAAVDKSDRQVEYVKKRIITL
jgi:hypothetical protein